MEKDHDDKSHWIELDKTLAIQGLLAEQTKEQRIERRVYVVTIETPLENAWIHDRWPRLVKFQSEGLDGQLRQ